MSTMQWTEKDEREQERRMRKVAWARQSVDDMLAGRTAHLVPSWMREEPEREPDYEAMVEDRAAHTGPGLAGIEAQYEKHLDRPWGDA